MTRRKGSARADATLRGRRRPDAPHAASIDGATRRRLLMSATRLFAKGGFAKVTVRDIVHDARANVAAVNYHFSGKLGLYQEVIDAAIGAMRSRYNDACAAPPGSDAEDKLRHYIRTFLAQESRSPDAEWIQHLVRHEMESPTPAVRSIVRQVMVPRFQFLSGVIATLMDAPANDARVKSCVLSVQAQCYFAHGMLRVKGRLHAAGLSEVDVSAPDDIAALAEHVCAFSLAGIRNARQVSTTTRGRMHGTRG